jgi:hypothetical protein
MGQITDLYYARNTHRAGHPNSTSADNLTQADP